MLEDVTESLSALQQRGLIGKPILGVPIGRALLHGPILNGMLTHDHVCPMMIRILACVATILTAGSLSGCSSSLGGGGSSPSRTYVIMPNGQEVPAQVTTQPPGN